jgi:oxygen-independent coproporphyrinogen-3 oxidase
MGTRLAKTSNATWMRKHSTLLNDGFRCTTDMIAASDSSQIENAAAATVLPSASPRAAYIHVPFCRHRCGYCNFTLVTGRDDLIEAYLKALERELSGLSLPREVDTLFFGGGTPSHLPSEQLARLLEIVYRWHPPVAGAEVSVEVNPIDLNEVKARILAKAGVTRFSLGVQSFQAWKLAALERDHDTATICAAMDRARRFAQSISIDLMFAMICRRR